MPKTPSPRPRPKTFRPPPSKPAAPASARAVHPLRELRDALGEVHGERLSQPAFAELLGVSASLINAIESNEARKVSEDLHQRILTRFGVRIEEASPQRSRPGARPARRASAPRGICLAFPELPLVEGLRRHQAEHPQIEAGALRSFDRGTIRRLRTILLAAHKAGKAAIALDLLQTRAEQIRHDLNLPAAAVAAAQKEIEAHRGQFPPRIVHRRIRRRPGLHQDPARQRHGQSPAENFGDSPRRCEVKLAIWAFTPLSPGRVSGAAALRSGASRRQLVWK